MEMLQELKDFLQQRILLNSNFRFVVENEPALSICHSVVQGRDVKGQYLTVSFYETVENYDYLHGMFGRELTVSLASQDTSNTDTVVRLDHQRVRWVAEHTELNAGDNSICELIARLEFI